MAEAPQTRIAELAEEAAREVGVEVLRAHLRQSARGRATVVVTIDRAEGVDMQAVAHMSHALERLLDREDPIAGSYVLEVESPGERRPLRLPRDAARFAGSVVDLSLRGPDGRRRLRGTLVDADDAEVCIRPGPDEGDIVRIPLLQVEDARLHPEVLSPAPAPKGRSGGRAWKGRQT